MYDAVYDVCIYGSGAAAVGAALAMLLYKPIVTALRKAGLVEASSSGKGGAKWGVIAVAGVLLVTFVLLALVLAGVL